MNKALQNPASSAMPGHTTGLAGALVIKEYLKECGRSKLQNSILLILTQNDA